jgi:hypothetical protein
MFFVGLIFLALCVGIPLYVLSGSLRESTVTEVTSPGAYLFFGLLIFGPAAYAWIIVTFGFLFPSWELIEPNALSTRRIGIPGRRSGPAHYLSLKDGDMSFMFSAILGFVAILGGYLLVRGVYLYFRQPEVVVVTPRSIPPDDSGQKRSREIRVEISPAVASILSSPTAASKSKVLALDDTDLEQLIDHLPNDSDLREIARHERQRRWYG